jgi:CspA family cold shock protein
MKGIIKRLNERGFGFIAPEGGQEGNEGIKDLFFHANDCVEGNFKEMKEGDAVTFDKVDSPKGPKAVKVSLVSSSLGQ